MATTIFGAGTLLIGVGTATDAVECQVGEFTVTSTANLIPIPPTLCQSASNAASPSTFSLTMQFMQDWGQVVSLSQTLFDADGTELAFIYTPTDVTVPTAEGVFWAVAGDYGGTGQQLWVSTDDMPMVEKPTITPQAP
jgi:hypothetical protein